MIQPGRNKMFWEWVTIVVTLLLFGSSYLLQAVVVDDRSLTAEVKHFEQEIAKQERDFEDLLNDSVLVNRLFDARETQHDVDALFAKKYFFFLYKYDLGTEYLRFWNTGVVLPPTDLLRSPPVKMTMRLPNGFYYVIKKAIPGKSDEFAYSLLLIRSSFYIETDYLKASYPIRPQLDNIVDISLEPTPYPVKSINGTVLFYFKMHPSAQIQKDSVFPVTLRILCIFFFFFTIYLLLYKQYGKKRLRIDIYIFVLCMVLFRLTLYFGNSFIHYRNFTLFDPNIYGSSNLLPSLGDLLINSLLFCWVSVFIWNRTRLLGANVQRFSTNIKWAISFCALALLVIITFGITEVIRSIISDSKISFDVTNLFSFSIYTVIGFLVLACISLGYYYFCQILFRYIFPIFGKRSYYVYFLIAITGLVYITLFVRHSETGFYLGCLTWLLFYSLVFNYADHLSTLIRFNISGTILWIFVFSVSIAILMLSQIRKNEIEQRKLYAEKLAAQTDPASERMISITNKYLDSSFFARNFSRFYDKTENQYLRDSIERQNYIGYSNHYYTQYYFFDSTGNGLYNPGDLSLASLNTIITHQSLPTNMPDVYFLETSYDKFSYITQVVIKNEEVDTLGYAYIISNPRKFANFEMSPELFKQAGQWELSNPNIYQYAIYTDNVLSSSSKQYPFTSSLLGTQIPNRRFTVKQNGDYSELWYKVSSKKVIVMVRKSETVIEAVSLFSYIFCAFLLLVAITQVFTLLIGYILNSRLFKKKSFFFPTIREQIYSTFVLISLFSFIIVGITTISFFINRYEQGNRERLARTMSIMVNELQLYPQLKGLLYDSVPVSNELFGLPDVQDLMKRVSNIHGTDINLYDLSGKLRASSQPDVYSKGVLSTQMSPEAFYNLLRLRHIEDVQEEKVSKFSFTSIYTPLRDSSGAFYAFVGIPSFQSQQALNQEISNFLVTLINLIAFVFLITGLVAILITNRITRSFMMVSDKLRKVSLAKNNEEIVWERNDEIGVLVTEYNKMVTELRAGADKLAKAEREVAWSEMARQVAHEIKNPLTPMKLSLQYLEKAINENRPNINELGANVAKTLVEQIDHLAKIAADFSQFANISQAKPVLLNLHDILMPLQEIYSKNPRVQYRYRPYAGLLLINGDRTQMNRLFTNLLVNAIEATDAQQICRISVSETVADGVAAITITDNGGGISPEQESKIFTPNFTTKSSGTGLGLAMCKRIAEQMGGSITFTTEPGVGTTFVVNIPIVTNGDGQVIH